MPTLAGHVASIRNGRMYVGNTQQVLRSRIIVPYGTTKKDDYVIFKHLSPGEGVTQLRLEGVAKATKATPVLHLGIRDWRSDAEPELLSDFGWSASKGQVNGLIFPLKRIIKEVRESELVFRVTGHDLVVDEAHQVRIYIDVIVP